MKTAKEFWQEKFDELPQNDLERLAVTMMREYADYFSSQLEPRVIKKNAGVDCNNCYECLKDKKEENGLPKVATRMILCPICGNKRCPKAKDHNLDCTNSNDSGQPGSRY